MPEATHHTSWRTQFGIEDLSPPVFFAGPHDIDNSGRVVPQAHLLRRAFDALEIDGALLNDDNPLVYFRVVERKLEHATVKALQRKVWNQGVAPILIIIDPEEVQIHSAFSVPENNEHPFPTSLIESLRLIDQDALQLFMREIQTGEYFRQRPEFFNPKHRVDCTLLDHLTATRDKLNSIGRVRQTNMPVRLLCRTVLACYLFDRDVVGKDYLRDAGIRGASHIRDIVKADPGKAKANLYRLFHRLAHDFNGDIFGQGLDSEIDFVRTEHVSVVRDFLEGTNPLTGQRQFWPYDFSLIPIEMISAIYERFLTDKKRSGSFYTRRSLAELVLSCALGDDTPTNLLTKTFLDPACGSGIFLVGIFNRLAEEWTRQHPNATYEKKLRGLTGILRTNIFGIDESATACLIAAFSLYLALLDQLSPPDIQRVLAQMETRLLPRLVSRGETGGTPIIESDFFSSMKAIQDLKVDFIIGNPPWTPNLPKKALAWCNAHDCIVPNKQLAVAFLWKTREHVNAGGQIYLVLPHGPFFNHTESHRVFRKRWLETCTLGIVVNLADFQRFLFDDAEVPAVIAGFTTEPHRADAKTRYLVPKASWSAIRTDTISIEAPDMIQLAGSQLLENADGEAAPSIWKINAHASARDVRLIERLRLYPKLDDVLGTRRGPRGRWMIAEGFELYKDTDAKKGAKIHSLSIPNAALITTQDFHRDDVVLSPKRYTIEPEISLQLRRGISDESIFDAPLVLVNEGFMNVAFADFNVVYKHGVRGIRGPKRDRAALRFLTVYLRSRLAKYFLFHTSSSWGVSRRRVDIDDLKLLPWHFPERQADHDILKECSKIFRRIQSAQTQPLTSSDDVTDEFEQLVFDYFQISASERRLIDDTMKVIEPSTRPTRKTYPIPAIMPVSEEQLSEYLAVLCETLDRWANNDRVVRGQFSMDSSLVVVMLEKRKSATRTAAPALLEPDVLATLGRLREILSPRIGTLRWMRGVKVFDGNRLYILKPRQRRFWTASAALNDADEIADAILEGAGER